MEAPAFDLPAHRREKYVPVPDNNLYSTVVSPCCGFGKYLDAFPFDTGCVLVDLEFRVFTFTEYYYFIILLSSSDSFVKIDFNYNYYCLYRELSG